jgi:hypothetical protein
VPAQPVDVRAVSYTVEPLIHEGEVFVLRAELLERILMVQYAFSGLTGQNLRVFGAVKLISMPSMATFSESGFSKSPSTIAAPSLCSSPAL